MNDKVQITLRDLREIVRASEKLCLNEWSIVRLTRANLEKDVPYDHKEIGRIGSTKVEICTGDPRVYDSFIWPSEPSSISFGSGGSERMNMSNPFLHDRPADCYKIASSSTDLITTIDAPGTAITGTLNPYHVKLDSYRSLRDEPLGIENQSPSTTEKTMTVHHYALIELEDGDPTGVILDTTMVAVLRQATPGYEPKRDSRDLAIAKFARTAKGSLLQDWDVVKVQ